MTLHALVNTRAKYALHFTRFTRTNRLQSQCDWDVSIGLLPDCRSRLSNYYICLLSGLVFRCESGLGQVFKKQTYSRHFWKRFFHRQNAIPATIPTVSKYWRWLM